MAKNVLFKRKSKGQGNGCHFCGDVAIWEARAKSGLAVLCCGSKHCRKKAEKYVK